MRGELPGVGQIWLRRADRAPDLYVLVIEVDQGHVQALLCGDECHRATDTDSVLEPRLSGCPRRLLVHGDLAGAILDDRLTHTTPAGTGSSSSSGNSAACARAPASSDGRCTSSALRPPKGRPRSLGRPFGPRRAPCAALFRLHAHDQLNSLLTALAPSLLDLLNPGGPAPSRRGCVQARTRGLRISSHRRSSF